MMPRARTDVSEVLDNPEWTKKDFGTAKPFAEVFPDLSAAIRRARGKQKAPTKVSVTLRLDRDVIERFKADGPGWQTRIGETLKKSLRQV